MAWEPGMGTRIIMLSHLLILILSWTGHISIAHAAAIKCVTLCPCDLVHEFKPV